MTKGKKTRGDVAHEIAVRAALGKSASEIHAELSSDPSIAVRIPARRTIQHLTSFAQYRQRGPAWRPASLDALSPEDFANVLAVQSVVTWITRGKVRVDEAQARWIATLRRASPELGLLETYMTANAYIDAQEREASTEGLDIWLAFRSAAERHWKDDGEKDWWQRNYDTAVKQKWIPPGPPWHPMREPELWSRQMGTEKEA